MIRQALQVPAPLQLWRVSLHQKPADTAIATLSEIERAQTRRFAFDHLQRRYLAAHVALRELLSEATGTLAKDLVFAHGAFGKPHLISTQNCVFNMSHSDDVALIAIAPSGEIGIDVEVLRPVPDCLALSKRNFTTAEHRHVAATQSKERDLTFLRGWTRKEACIKALGYGLSIAPESFETGVHTQTSTVSIPTPQGMAQLQVMSLPESAGCVMALAWVISGTLTP